MEKAIKNVRCPRCEGHRYILGQKVDIKRENPRTFLPNYRKMKAGVCFLCDGIGHVKLRVKDNKIIKHKNGAVLLYSSSNGDYLGIDTEASKPQVPEFEPVPVSELEFAIPTEDIYIK